MFIQLRLEQEEKKAFSDGSFMEYPKRIHSKCSFMEENTGERVINNSIVYVVKARFKMHSQIHNMVYLVWKLQGILPFSIDMMLLNTRTLLRRNVLRISQ